MRSRVTILLMLVFGFAFSGVGTGLAVQSLDQNTTPSEAQYGPAPTTDETPPPSGGGVNPETDEEPGEVLDEGGVAPEQETGGNAPTGSAPTEDVQVTRQTGVQETGDSLPMTGFPAIPVLLIGIALLVGGFVLRGSARKDAGA